MRGWGSYGDLKSRELSLVTTTEKKCLLPCKTVVWRRRPDARDSAEGSGVSPIHSLVLRNAIFNDF